MKSSFQSIPARAKSCPCALLLFRCFFQSIQRQSHRTKQDPTSVSSSSPSWSLSTRIRLSFSWHRTKKFNNEDAIVCLLKLTVWEMRIWNFRWALSVWNEYLLFVIVSQSHSCHFSIYIGICQCKHGMTWVESYSIVIVNWHIFVSLTTLYYTFVSLVCDTHTMCAMITTNK